MYVKVVYGHIRHDIATLSNADRTVAEILVFADDASIRRPVYSNTLESYDFITPNILSLCLLAYGHYKSDIGCGLSKYILILAYQAKLC
jgi:hypothetical protein